MNNLSQSKYYRKALTSYFLMFLILAMPIGCVSRAILEPLEDKEQVALYENEVKKIEEQREQKKAQEYKKHSAISQKILNQKVKLLTFIRETEQQKKVREHKMELLDEKMAKEQERYDSLAIHDINPIKVNIRRNSEWFEWLQTLLVLALYGLMCWSIHRQKISFNQDGVWAEIGMFPWTRGEIFVKWEDIERVGYSQNPIGWLFGSAHVHIVRRYSGRPEIIKSIFRGKEFSGIATGYKYREIDGM